MSGEPSLEQLLAEARELKQKLLEIERRLRELENTIQAWIAKTNSVAAQLFERVTPEFTFGLLQDVLHCMALPEDQRKKFAAEAIERAELQLQVEPGTFRSVSEADLDPASGDGLGHMVAKAEHYMEETSLRDATRDASSWLPALVRIGSAILVATVVGAPLSALAVHEPIAVEVVKTGIAVTAGVVAAEGTNLLLDRKLDPSLPDERSVAQRPPHRSDDLDPPQAHPTKPTQPPTLSPGSNERPLPNHDPGERRPNHAPVEPEDPGDMGPGRNRDPFSGPGS